MCEALGVQTVDVEFVVNCASSRIYPSAIEPALNLEHFECANLVLGGGG